MPQKLFVKKINLKYLAYYFLIIIFLISFAEVSSYFVGNFLSFKKVFYRPPEIFDYWYYKDQRHPILGWPTKRRLNGESHDSSGSRFVPSFPKPGNELISLYGNSFVYGSEVKHAETWGNFLSIKIGFRVANFGIPGYGTDQAYLRFKQNLQTLNDQAQIVVLCHLSENILRNVSQWRHLLQQLGQQYTFKPRFVLNTEEEMELVPLPTFTMAEYNDLLIFPEKYLHQDYFIVDGPSGLTRLKFPYSLSILSAFNQFNIRSRVQRKPWYYDFYNTDHDSQALKITIEIMKMFCDEAKQNNRLPVLIHLPQIEDLKYYRKHKVWTYDPLIDAFSNNEIDILNLGASLLEHIGDRDPEELYIMDGRKHLNAEGNAITARIVYNYLYKKGYLLKVENL